MQQMNRLAVTNRFAINLLSLLHVLLLHDRARRTNDNNRTNERKITHEMEQV